MDVDDFFDPQLRGGAGTPPGPEALDPVARVTLPDDPVEQESWRRGLARLGGVRHEHVVPVLGTSVDSTASGSQVLVVQHDLPAGARPAIAWIPAGHRLSPGECVTLGVALARGLAALHHCGACRAGQLSLADVVVDGQGRPAWRLSHAIPRGRADEADDVGALAHLLSDLLSARAAPGPLLLALLRGQDEDPRRRPTAAELADALAASVAPQPLRLPSDLADDRSDEAEGERRPSQSRPEPVLDRSGAPPASVATARALPPRPTAAAEPAARRLLRHLSGRWRAAAVGLVAVVALAGVARGAVAQEGERPERAAPAAEPVASTAAPSTPPPEPTASTAPSTAEPLAEPVAEPAARPSEDPTAIEAWGAAAAPVIAAARGPELPWEVVLAGLDAIRSTAFAEADEKQLARAIESGSPAWEVDRATLRALSEAGLAPRGFSLRVVSAEVVSRSAAEVRLRVVDRRGAYDLVDSSGQVRDRQPERPEASWLITLVAPGGAGQWRMSEVMPASAAAPPSPGR